MIQYTINGCGTVAATFTINDDYQEAINTRQEIIDELELNSFRPTETLKLQRVIDQQEKQIEELKEMARGHIDFLD